MIDYRFCIEEGVYVVWIAGINRYMQLQEPAFRVFEFWASGSERMEIAKVCAERYGIQETESIGFVNEIIDKVQQLIDSKPADINQHTLENFTPEQPDYYSEYTYKVGDNVFRFIYRNGYLEDLFHPLFGHFVNPHIFTDITATFELFTQNEMDILKVNEVTACAFPTGSIDLFQGTVYMEMLNIIYTMSLSDWMGVLHASAVTDGEKAILFTAPSGCGKSTIAMLMMAQGYASLSDDFVPVAIREPEVYHFPAGISVKPGAAALLKDQLPQLEQLQVNPVQGEEMYVAPASSNIQPNVPACAIVFVKYDPEVTFELKREPNLGMMNDLIRQSWIAGTPEAAERFLNWYFNLPVYSLRYSDNKSAVEGIIKLFD